MNFVVENDEDAEAPRIGRAGDLQRIDQIGPGIGAERARRALRPDEDDPLRDADTRQERKLTEAELIAALSSR